MRRHKRLKAIESPQPIVPEGFVAAKPKRGQWLVSLDREKIYGEVVTVRSDGSLTYLRVLDGLKTDTAGKFAFRTWEDIQYDFGRMRFVDEVPSGFTNEGNNWSRNDV